MAQDLQRNPFKHFHRSQRLHGPARARRGPCQIVFAAVLASLPLTAFAETRTFDLSGFDGVSAAEGIRVIIDVGERFSVIAESDEPRQIERLVLDVRRGTLRARMDNRPFSFTRTKGWKVTVRISMPELTQAETSSGAELVADDVSGAAIELVASSGSALRISAMTGDAISANASSGARIEASGGTCGSLSAVASSGSFLDLSSVECTDVKVDASSGSEAGVFANRLIDANASSGASVRVYGTREQIEINSSSGGNILFP